MPEPVDNVVASWHNARAAVGVTIRHNKRDADRAVGVGIAERQCLADCGDAGAVSVADADAVGVDPAQPYAVAYFHVLTPNPKHDADQVVHALLDRDAVVDALVDADAIVVPFAKRVAQALLVALVSADAHTISEAKAEQLSANA